MLVCGVVNACFHIRLLFLFPPIFLLCACLCVCSSWCQGRVALLGDSAHAMQPNLGQGGCMAIEDAFQLGVDMGEALDKVCCASVSFSTGACLLCREFLQVVVGLLQPALAACCCADAMNSFGERLAA